MMDNYPEHLAPELDKNSRNPITPFDDWWPEVRTEFSNIPEEIAREWLYRHWGMSPYSWISSSSYEFDIEKYPSSQLSLLLNRCYNFEAGNDKIKEKGQYLCDENPNWKWRPIEPIWLVKFMNENGAFPSPIVVLDNKDNHLAVDSEITPEAYGIPKGLVLIEGHTRHEIGTYLESVGRLAEFVEVCMLRKKLATDIASDVGSSQ